MRPHSPNYTLSSHYCPVTPGHGPLIVMGEGWEEGGCERHQIFSGNWSVIVKTPPITLSYVTTVDKLQSSNWKSKRIKFWIISCVLFSVYADIVTPLVPGLCLWGWRSSVDLSPGCRESRSHELMSLRHKLSAHNQNGFSSSWTASLTISQKSQVVNCIQALKSLVIFGLVNFYVNFDFNVMVLYVYDFFPPDENSRVSEKFFRK